ncbi:hypothetical protein PAULA_0015 [Escherichia phage Paula]|nr:hypothetical protein PAULA_0015 [Escherichia phage Paula]
MAVQSFEETVKKQFLSKRAMVEFLHFLEVDRVLIETTPDGNWQVSYIATRHIVDSTKEESSGVTVAS